jgi:hypothetical protein
MAPGGSGTMAPGQEQSKQPATLADKAELAFRQCRDADGLQCLCAHALVSDDKVAGETLKKMGWLAAQKKPAFTVRWGLGIEISPKTYNGKVFPVGTPQQNVQGKPRLGGERQRGAGQPGMGQPGMGQPGMGQPGIGQPGVGGGTLPLALQELTGEVGQRLVQQLQERLTRGDFGKVYAFSAGAKPAAGAGADMASGSGTVAPGMGQPGMGQPGMGQPGMGQPGMGQPGMGQPGMGQPGMGTGQPGMQQAGPAPVAPGIMLLGVAPTKELRKRATDAELDVLCVFSLTVNYNPRNETVRNDTVIFVYDAAAPNAKEAYKSKAINNIQVQIERMNPGGADTVAKELEGLFKYVDATWRIGDLPAELQAEHVLNRLRTLITATYDNPLPVLAEIRMYRTRGLLEEKNLAIAYKRLLGDQSGGSLATGSEDDKKRAIEKWLPRSL